MTDETMPSYDDLAAKVKEHEIQEQIFRTIIQQMEQLYSQVASSQSEIEHKNEQIEGERRRLHAILKNIADGLVVIDSAGRVILANQAFGDFFQKEMDVLSNRHISEVIDNTEFVSAIMDALDGPDRSLVKQIQLRDGRFIRNTSSPIVMDNSVQGVVSIFRDVTLEVELDRMKTDFISTVSHELRTPLTSILGFAQIIKKKLNDVIFQALPPGEAKGAKTVTQVNQNLDIILSEGERLTKLINDVLDIAKIEAGRVEWKDEDVRICEVFEQAAIATSALFQKKGLSLTRDVLDESLVVRGDRDRLMQVATNLFSNAVKFTEKGGVTFGIREKNGMVRCSVEDTGTGIPPEMLESVFEKFKQIGDTLTNRPQGTGLGLPICREIIGHHGGRIWAECAEGLGSAFVFEIPLKKRSRAKIRKDVLMKSIEGKILDSGGKGRLILIVDDDASIRSMLRQSLEDHGYRAIEAVDASDAIAKARSLRPDIILLDIMMPDLSGYDVLRVLKHDDITRDIPVIIVSVLEDREKALMLGASHYLTKPVDETGLYESITKVQRENGSKHRFTILIIDGDGDSRKEIASFMAEKEFDVIESDGDEGSVTEGLRRTPDLILVDVDDLEENAAILLGRDESILQSINKSKFVYMIKGGRDYEKNSDR